LERRSLGMSNEKMQFSYLKEVKERALELAEIVKNKSDGNAILLPVTKGFGAEEVQAMLEVGLTHVGESYAQEVIEKAQIISDNRIAWHMIGRVQSNKVRKLSETISLWHSVDRKDLITEISKRKKDSKVLIQVDMNNRPQQGG